MGKHFCGIDAVIFQIADQCPDFNAILVIGGFFVFRFITKRELKKNPPINKDQVRALLRATGRTPSEADVERAMKAMNDAKSPNYNPYAGMSKKKKKK